MDDEYIKAITDEANRIAHERWFACEKAIKPWMIPVIFEAEKRVKKGGIQD